MSTWAEADVLRFFRSLGTGHTTRRAEVLATFMHARLAAVARGPEDVGYYAAEREAEVEERELIREYAEILKKERAKDTLDATVVEGFRRGSCGRCGREI